MRSEMISILWSGLYIDLNKRYRDKYFSPPSGRLINGWETNICPANAGLFYFYGKPFYSIFTIRYKGESYDYR